MLRCRLTVEGLLLGILLAALACGRPMQSLPPPGNPNPTPVVCNHVVTVYDGQGGCGTGWALTGDLIVTCLHVVKVGEHEVGTHVSVVLPIHHFPTPVTVLGVSERFDVAVLQLTSPDNAPLYPLNVSDGPVAMGQWVTSIGFPQCDGPVLTSGFTVEPFYDGFGVQTSLYTLGGASGSPVMDETGTVVGMIQRAWEGSNRGIFIGPSGLRQGIAECLKR